MCGCREQINDRLKERNGRLAFGFTFNDNTMALSAPMIEVEKIVARGKKPPTVLATFCPFCGTRYE